MLSVPPLPPPPIDCCTIRGFYYNMFLPVLKMKLSKVSEIMKNAEAKGEEGEVDEAQELFQEAEELQQQKASLEAKALQVPMLPPV